MSWVAVGVTAASVVTGAVASNQSKKASKAQSRAEEQALNEGRRQFEMSQASMAPWRYAGVDSLAKLSNLMGTSSRTAAVPTDPRSPKDVAGAVYLLDGNGTPIVNHARYAEDPAYKAAWDRYLHQHQTAYGTGYTPDSDKGALSQALKTLTAEERNKQGIADPTAIALEEANADPAYGSLNKKFTVDDFWSDPVTKLGFQFGLDEGRKGLERNANASGMRNSGQTLKALTRFGEDYASTMAAGSAERFYGDQDRDFNRFASISGLGQTATQNTAALGGQFATNAGNIMTAGGNARGAAAIAQGNAWGGALNNVGNWWAQNQMMKQLTTPRPAVPAPNYNSIVPS